MLKLSPDKLFLRKLWLAALQANSPIRLRVSSYKEATRYRFALYELAKQVRGEEKSRKDPALGEAVEACQVNIDKLEDGGAALIIQRKLLAPGLVELQEQFAALQGMQEAEESAAMLQATGFLDQEQLDTVQASLRRLRELGIVATGTSGAASEANLPQPNPPSQPPTDDPQPATVGAAPANPYYTR